MVVRRRVQITLAPGERVDSQKVLDAIDSALRAGLTVEISSAPQNRENLPSIDEILADYPGGRLYKTAEEVDADIRAERDSWDR